MTADRPSRAAWVVGLVGTGLMVWWVIRLWADPPWRFFPDLADGRFRAVHIVVLGAILLGAAAVALLTRWTGRPGRLRVGRRTIGLSPGGKVAVIGMAILGPWIAAEIVCRAIDAVRGTDRATTYYGPGPAAADYSSHTQVLPTRGRLGVIRERFRGPPITPAKSPGEVRIFSLGGSAAFLEHVPVDRTYTALVGDRVRQARPGVTVSAQIAACPGWTSQHSLINFCLRVQDFKPDVVIFMHAAEDLGYSFYLPDGCRRPFERDYGHAYGPMAYLAKRRFRNQPGCALDRSRAWWYLRHALREWLATDPPRPGQDDVEGLNPESRPPGACPSLWCYRRNVDTLATLLRLDGARLVLMTQPTCVPDGDAGAAVLAARFGRPVHYGSEAPVGADALRDGLRAFNEATRDPARRLDVSLVDLDEALTDNADLFADPWTLNGRGCQAATDRIADVLLPLVPSYPPGR